MRSGLVDGAEQTSSAERDLQQGMLRDTLGLLLSAGYFRARLPHVEAFDKVRTNGWVWCHVPHSP